MRYHIQGYLMGGAYFNYTASELLMGFNSNIAVKINGGDFMAGNDYDLTDI